jgi:hypothetical protein
MHVILPKPIEAGFMNLVKKVRHFRDGKWTESVAVGSRAFVTETKERLGVRDRGRKLVGTGESCELVPIHVSIKGTD